MIAEALCWSFAGFGVVWFSRASLFYTISPCHDQTGDRNSRFQGKQRTPPSNLYKPSWGTVLSPLLWLFRRPIFYTRGIPQKLPKSTALYTVWELYSERDTVLFLDMVYCYIPFFFWALLKVTWSPRLWPPPPLPRPIWTSLSMAKYGETSGEC